MAIETLSSPKGGAFSVTPNDSVDLTIGAIALYIGTGGDVKLTTSFGQTVTFVNLGDGQILPVRTSRVYASGTDATDIVGLY
jgi:hypothetical protein